MKTVSENACSQKVQTDLRLAWGRSYHRDGSSTHQTLRYHLTPAEQTVAVAVVGGLRHLVALLEAAAAACLVVAWGGMADRHQHLLKLRWDLLGRSCRLVDRTPVLAHHNGSERSTDSNWFALSQN